MNTSVTVVGATALKLRGVVQGVGMRPLIYRIASELNLVGDVSNDRHGVTVRLWANNDEIAAFVARLRRALPAGARIDTITTDAAAPTGPKPADFNIAASTEGRGNSVIPDRASCAKCIAEIFDHNNRRFSHPFNSCTDCGPRFSILRAGVWDRRNTVMEAFAFCRQCHTEYRRADDRRFHAETIACRDCGPKLYYRQQGSVYCKQQIERAAAAIAGGEVIAVQGIGCFQLVCAASSNAAVERLRKLKQRPNKPLAVMVRDRQQLNAIVEADERAWTLLSSPESPIVVLPAHGRLISPRVAPGLDSLGVMLANSPLHHLLVATLEMPIVVSSANLSGYPAIGSLEELDTQLPAFSGQVLYSDRPIVNRLDDSLAQLIANTPRLLRRSRGYVPRRIDLPPGFASSPAIMALGGHHKNTLCLLAGQALQLSSWLGDLDSPAQRAVYDRELASMEQQYGGRLHYACDHHPDYYSSHHALAQQRDASSTLQAVWHHHAHAAACLAEHRRHRDAPPLLALVFDGSGLGPDNSIWGGEFLLCDYRGFRRLAHLAPTPLFGGELAIKQPWRSLWSHLHSSDLWHRLSALYPDLDVLQALQDQPFNAYSADQLKQFNAPLSSSVGRLFDAVAAAVGICFAEISYEGEAAMRLQAQAERSDDDTAYPFHIEKVGNQVELNPAAMWMALFDDLASGCSTAQMARRFHNGLAQSSASIAEHLFGSDPNWQEPLVALSGGVFQNALLYRETARRLQRVGLSALGHGEIPSNDSGIAVGQALVSAAQLMHAERRRPQKTMVSKHS